MPDNYLTHNSQFIMQLPRKVGDFPFNVRMQASGPSCPIFDWLEVASMSNWVWYEPRLMSPFVDLVDVRPIATVISISGNTRQVRTDIAALRVVWCLGTTVIQWMQERVSKLRTPVI